MLVIRKAVYEVMNKYVFINQFILMWVYKIGGIFRFTGEFDT